MYRLNITFVVEPNVQDRWMEFMHGKFIPSLRTHGYMHSIFSRVVSVDAVTHFTYSLLIELDSMNAYAHLTNEVWSEYVQIADPLFGMEVIWFMSLMKEIENE